jgi:hypothetical protein
MRTMHRLALVTLLVIALIVGSAAIAYPNDTVTTPNPPQRGDTVHAIVTDKWQIVLYLMEVETSDGRTDTLMVTPEEWGRLETYGDVVYTRERE